MTKREKDRPIGFGVLVKEDLGEKNNGRTLINPKVLPDRELNQSLHDL